MKRTPKYKPLLFTTTMRNPERLKDFLAVFYEYNGEILTNQIIEKIAMNLIKVGLYQPVNVSDVIKNKWKQDIELSNQETEKVFLDNPQSHKEAGFDKGWASRFDTWFKISKELGFVYYWQNQKIEFSKSGRMLLDRDNPQNEQLIFANAFAKYHRDNPFRRILNSNTPLVLLVKTINLLNEDTNFNSTGVSKKEIPLLLCWRDDNAENLYKTIKEIRKKHGFNPSNEIILEYCDNLLDDIKRDEKSILVDYPDDFIRKMRLTGLISIRGGGRFIDINKNEKNAVEFLIKNYSSYQKFNNEKDFFNFIGVVDYDFINTFTISKSPVKTSKKELEKWIEYYQWETIKSEMISLSKNKSSQDDILKFIEEPLRLEFLTTLAILKKLPHVTVKPNFISDDEGLPTSFASGGIPDIECSEEKETVLVEVTLLTGTQQHIRESYSIQRHLEDFLNKGQKAYSLFISPKVFIDTCRNAKFIKYQYNHEVKILDIELFLSQLESQNSLRKVAFTTSSCKDE
jgi:hypothetical protein